MARIGNVDIGSIFEEYLQKEQEFGQEIEEWYLYRNFIFINALYNNPYDEYLSSEMMLLFVLQ